MTIVNDLDNKIVKVSNAVARMRYSDANGYIKASRWEGRIIAIVAAQVSADDKEFREYKIPVTFLKKIACQKKSGNLFKRILKIARTLASRHIEIKEDNGWTLYPIFSKFRYNRGDDYIAVRFDPDLKDHYIGLKKHFTVYGLNEYLSLPSTYSQHLYSFLRSWDDRIGLDLVFTVEDLHKKLNTPPSMRKNFSEFRRGALDVATQHINKLTSLKFGWEPIIKGRKIIKIKFRISDNGNKKNLPIEKILEGIPDYTLAKIPKKQKDDLKFILIKILDKYGKTGVRCFIGYAYQKQTSIRTTWGAFIGGLLKKGWYVELQAEAEKDKYALYDLPPAGRDEFDPWGPENIEQIMIWASTPQHEYFKKAQKWLLKNGYKQIKSDCQQHRHCQHKNELTSIKELFRNAMQDGRGQAASIKEIRKRVENGDQEAQTALNILQKCV